MANHSYMTTDITIPLAEFVIPMVLRGAPASLFPSPDVMASLMRLDLYLKEGVHVAVKMADGCMAVHGPGELLLTPDQGCFLQLAGGEVLQVQDLAYLLPANLDWKDQAAQDKKDGDCAFSEECVKDHAMYLFERGTVARFTGRKCLFQHFPIIAVIDAARGRGRQGWRQAAIQFGLYLSRRLTGEFPEMLNNDGSRLMAACKAHMMLVEGLKFLVAIPDAFIVLAEEEIPDTAVPDELVRGCEFAADALVYMQQHWPAKPKIEEES